MTMKPTRQGFGMLLVAYVFAAVVVGFGVAVIASFLGLPAIAVAVLVALALLALGHLVFRGRPVRSADTVLEDKE
jgi:hypothetical protein